tara:strand:+ start:29 stop:736 length:708 start_codon:yes stop_codon:yes gene_type:complete
MQIVRLKSQQAITPYAPQWDAPLAFIQWDQPEKVDTIREFLLSKEEEILKLPFQGQGRTGLDDTAVTTRYGRYNVFDFADECPELNDMLDWVRESWAKFITMDQTQAYNLRYTCWYNIIRKGQTIENHRHCAGDGTYLSANIHLDDYKDSGTIYEHMEMGMKLANVKGGLTFFPGYVTHGVPEYTGDNPRVSLAFDLYVYQPPWQGVQDHLKHNHFITPEEYANMYEKLNLTRTH